MRGEGEQGDRGREGGREGGREVHVRGEEEGMEEEGCLC